MPTSNELRQTGRRETTNRQGKYAQVAEQLRLTMQSERKPGNYWDDFASVETELLAFIKVYGTPGTMPIDKELLQAGRRDLAKAIRKYNGVEAVAQRLGLQLPSHKRKRRGYWDDFANVTSELLKFIAEHGTPGVMPKQNDLAQAGRRSLAMAIDRHEGFFTVAQLLGLQLSHAQHPDGYWDDFANIERELVAYIEKCGTQGIMPSRGELMKASLGDLAGAFDKYGGSSAVAERLGLRMKIKPMGHWDNFAHVEASLHTYIKEHGMAGMMPTALELQKAGYSSLVIAITQKYDGFSAVAERLGFQLSYTAKPGRYWDDFAHIKLAIYEFNEARGMPGVMPTGSELKKAGKSDLASAITNHGGFPSLAEQFGLLYTYTAKPDHYWEDFTNVQQEILDFNQTQGTPGRMPTTIELRNAGKHSLAAAINAHGGFPAVAERLGLIATTKPNGHWDDFANVEQELLAFIQEQGTPGVMPTVKALKVAGRSHLIFAINKHGGMSTVAERLGLQLSYTQKPSRYWNDFASLKEALLQFIEAYGTPGMMPTRTELQEAGRSDLDSTLNKHGGLLAVARRLGLRYTSGERITSHTAEIVERLARSIQPLAESNLLSGAQIMIIQRRAGLLDYRHPRITRLNTSLAHGHHDAIELALAQLDTVGELLLQARFCLKAKLDLCFDQRFANGIKVRMSHQILTVRIREREGLR